MQEGRKKKRRKKRRTGLTAVRDPNALCSDIWVLPRLSSKLSPRLKPIDGLLPKFPDGSVVGRGGIEGEGAAMGAAAGKRADWKGWLPGGWLNAGVGFVVTEVRRRFGAGAAAGGALNIGMGLVAGAGVGGRA